MLQFFDDLPDDRWAAFLYVERFARQQHLTPSVIARRKYIQMVLVAAHELSLRILPGWQSKSGLLYRTIAIGIHEDDKNGDNAFAAFEKDLAAVMPKIESLAKRGTASRSELYTSERPQVLDIAEEL
jgi:hypothetical protein